MTRYRLDPQFHCSYLDSRGVPEKPRGKKRGKLSPFDFRFTTSGDVISGDATSGRACAHDHFRHPLIAPPQMRFELCPYTTNKTPTMLLGMKHKQFLPLIRHPPCYWDETQTVLTFYKTPIMLLGMKHKPFLPFIRHPPCYWG